MNRIHIAPIVVVYIVIATVAYFLYTGAKGEREPPPAMEFNINMNQALQHDPAQSNTTEYNTFPPAGIWSVVVLVLLDIVIIAILARHMRRKGNQ